MHFSISKFLKEDHDLLTQSAVFVEHPVPGFFRSVKYRTGIFSFNKQFLKKILILFFTENTTIWFLKKPTQCELDIGIKKPCQSLVVRKGIQKKH